MIRSLLIGLNLLAPLALVWLSIGGQFWIGLACLFLTHMLTLFATLVPDCAWWGPVVKHLDADFVWLTIDDGPDPQDTPEILKLLESHGAKASFFVIGEKAQRWPELIEAICRAGHRVENHTLTHPQFHFWRFGPRRIRTEIASAQAEIESAAGRAPALFRAPAGFRNLFVHPVLRSLGLRLIGWSVRGRDGVSTDREAIVRRLEGGIGAGAIVLMHEGKRDADGNSIIRDTLPQVLEKIAVQGLKIKIPEANDF